MDTDEIRNEVERFQARVKDLESRLDYSRQELQLWAEILRIRESKDQYREALRQNLSLIPAPESQTNPAEGYGSKARGLRAFVRAHAEDGVTVAELVAESVRLGSHKNAGYRFVGRLTEGTSPELERRGDRIFPTEHLKGD